MNTRNIYTFCGLFTIIGLLSMLASCGSPKLKDEGEGFVYDTIPVFEKDTFLYPLATRSSGYEFPEVYFGDVKAIDADMGTAWQTIPGLVTGEYIEFDFDSLFISGFEIFMADDIRYSQVKNLRIYAEGKLLGIYPPNMRIPIARKVNTLRIELGETQGINKVDIPFKVDSAETWLTKSMTSESIYASKSAGVVELVFFDGDGSAIHLRSLPVKRAKMNFYGVAEPQQMNNARLMFDGRKGFGWRGISEPKDKTLLFSFNEDQIVNGLFFPFTENLNITKIGFRLRKRALPEYAVEYKGGNGIFIPLKNTLKGKNFELVILETKNNEPPFIPELLFHDGSRLFSIYSDSLEFYQKQRIDSAKNTALSYYLDARVVTRTDINEYNHPLHVIFDKKKTVTDTLPNKNVKTENTFRLCSNGTFLAHQISTEQFFDREAGSRTQTKACEGYWMYKSKSKESVTITCYSELKQTETSFTPGKEPMVRTTTNPVTFEATLVLNHITFSNYFRGMTTGY